MTGRLTGKVALITGAARGLGRACALRFAEEGADLVLLDIGVVGRIANMHQDLGSGADLDHTAARAREFGGAALTRYVDVRDGTALAGAVDAAREAFGAVDVVVAAAWVASHAPAWELTEVQWRTSLDVNLTGAWQTAKAVAPMMIEQQAGSIIFIGSTSAHRPEPNRAHDAAATSGIGGLARAFGRELASHNVRVNSVDAGEVPPVEIANAALFLASDEARCITGTSLAVDLGALVT